MREISFAPNRVTAICFANDRDLLVAMNRSICLINCTTYMTKSMVEATSILDLEFEDDVHEHALTFNNDIL